MRRNHPVFSWLYDYLVTPQEYLGLARIRRRMLASIAGRVLEIRVGTGLNLPYYGPDARVMGIEPDTYMLRRAASRRQSAKADVTLLAALGEAIPFKAASFDAAVGTLVFCTIPDPKAALSELRRVMKPGASFYFLEHVRGKGRRLGWLQDRIDPVWSRIFAGCHPNRETLRVFSDAGLRIGQVTASRHGILVRGRAATI